MTSSPEGTGQAFVGTFLHAPTPDALVVLEDALVEIDATGTITNVSTPPVPGHAEAMAAARSRRDTVSADGAGFFLPGLVDLHVHAPQWPQLGRALHLPLEDWLQEATFPLESRYADIDFARPVYDSLVRTLLAGGTTTAVYFATLHDAATRLLADTCIALGQRALVGRVAMDHPEQCPAYYRDASAAVALEGSEALIDYLRGASSNAGRRVLPAITPRFVPSCTDTLLDGLGTLAERHDCHVQTHCSESDWEHDFVRARLGRSDTEALRDFGLLRRGSVLAHCNRVGDGDLALIRERGAGVAHCALSNAYFAGSVFPLRKALAHGVRVGLGTDISGGPSASMFDVAAQTVTASRLLESGVDPGVAAAKRGVPGARVDYVTAFHLATAGGGDVLGLPIGRFEPGYRFDAVMIDTGSGTGGVVRFEGIDTPADLLQKTLYGATRADIGGVWVDGRSVAGSP